MHPVWLDFIDFISDYESAFTSKYIIPNPMLYSFPVSSEFVLK